MTPEQNEQWQKAVPWLDYLDFHALSDHGRQEADRRLESWDVSEWAIWFRARMIAEGWIFYDKEPWVPNFALRSEVALVGLQIRYPGQEEAELAARRLLLLFVAEELRPFVEHARRADWYRRSGYKAVVKLFQLCERSRETGSIATWPKDLKTYPQSLFWELLYRLTLQRASSNVDEVYWARCLGYDLFSDITSLMSPGTLRLRDKSAIWRIGGVLDALTRQHWRRLENTRKEEHCTHLIATAYLTALEAVCPPPDWLPRG